MSDRTPTAGRGPETPDPASALARYARARKKRILRERMIESVLFLAACVSVLTTVGIVYVLVKESLVFFTKVPVWEFLTDTEWTPLFAEPHFGIWVLM